MKYLLLPFSLVLFCFGCKATKQGAGNSAQDPVVKVMSKHAKSFLKDDVFSSVSVGIYYDGQEYIQHFGELDPGQANQAQDETLFEIASVSKTIAGLLTANAVLENKISLEDDIQQYLDDDYSNLAFEDKPVKVKHLLSHTSRLPKFLPTKMNDLFNQIDENLSFRVYEIESQYSRAQFFKDLKEIKLDRAPGEQYEYSNADTELLAHIMENIYDQPYEELITEKVLSKAGMNQTKIYLDETEKQRLANGYGETGKKMPHFANTLWGSGGGLKSTLPDLVNYMRFLLVSDDPMIQESFRSLYKNEDREIGYYWPIQSDDRDGTFYGHHGGAYGTQTWLFVMPKHQLGVTVITNESDPNTAGKLIKLVGKIIDDLR